LDPVVQERIAPPAKQLAACLLCAFSYTFFKRQHHCTVCNASCCDSCSKRPGATGGKTARCCDACYNRATKGNKHANARLSASNSMRESATSAGSGSGSGSGSGKSANTSSNKAALVAGSSTSNPASPTKVDSTANVLAQTKDALQQRGEKLEQVQEKSQELHDAASGFADMARQLNKAQQSRWF